MSTPARPRSSTPLQPTRQQLDELIELMQRMLALPENPVEEIVKDEERGARGEGGGTRDEAVEPGTSLSSLTSPSSPLAPPPPPLSVSRVPLQRAASSEPRSEVRGPGAHRISDLWLSVLCSLLSAGLVAINGAFDGCMTWLGAPGRWLGGPRGRTWLGWTGLVLLAAALVGYLLLGMGWTW